MTEKFREYLVKYQSLKILSSKDVTSITKDDICRIREKIISMLDDELKFIKMYEILKSIEKEGSGFYIGAFRCERMSEHRLEKEIYQKVEFGIKDMKGLKFYYVYDAGSLKFSKDYLNIKPVRKIRPEQIKSVPNTKIIKSMKLVDEKLYEDIVEKVIDTLFDEVGVEFKEKLLRDIMSRVIVNNNLGEYLENMFCIKKENNTFALHFFEDESRKNKQDKSIYHNICEVYDELLKRLSNTTSNNESDIQKSFYLELMNI